MDLFKRAKVEFLNTETGEQSQLYQPTNWYKTRSNNGSAFDALTIERDFPPKQADSEQEEKEVNFTVRVSLWLDSTPERFLVSE